MAILGTDADLFSDLLILAEIVITILVILGVREIRRQRIARHRRFMLSALGLNLVFLTAFLINDAIQASTTVERGLDAPLWLFVPLLSIHLIIAISTLVIAIMAWRIARRGTVRDGNGEVVNVVPEVRKAHRRVSRYYPWMWYSTLGTGFLLYGTLYVF